MGSTIDSGDGNDVGNGSDSGSGSGSGSRGVRPAVALGQAFAQHRERLAHTVRLRMTPALCGRVGPDDVVQDAFVAATRRLDDFQRQPADAVFVWLRTLVMQALIDVTRAQLLAQSRSKTREVPLQVEIEGGPAATLDLASQLISQLTSPTRALARSEIAEIVQQELDSMAEIDREVLLLRHFEGMSNGEVARALSLHKSAATARHLRALRRLRESLRARPEFAGGDEE